MTPYRKPDPDETGLSSAEIRIGMAIGVIVDHYALLTHANGDPAIRSGWRPYLAQRMPEIERDLPGLSDAVRSRVRALQASSRTSTANAKEHAPC